MQALDYDVVIPTRGCRPDLLRQAIDSVRRQSVPPAIIVVVVDGDPSVAAQLPIHGQDLKVLCTMGHKGPAVARQLGIDAASAEWVAFLDDDDLWSPSKQEAMADYITAHPDCLAVRSGYWVFSADQGGPDGINGVQNELVGDRLDVLERQALTARRINDLEYLDIEGDSLGLMLEYNRGSTSSSMVRLSVLRATDPVPIDQRPGDEYLLFCSVAEQAEWHLVRRRLMYYRLHRDQDTRQSDSAGARRIVTSKVRAWERLRRPAPRPLVSYGAAYRVEIRRLLWGLAKSGEAREFWRTFVLARRLLPRVRDWLSILLPEPLVWRVRYRWVRRGGDDRASGLAPAW